MAEGQGKTSKLVQLMNVLKKYNNHKPYNYTVPDLWNVWNYQGEEMIKTSSGELIVNPYNFYYEVIRSYILPQRDENIDYSKPLYHIIETNTRGGDWIQKSVVYSMMIRTSTAWDHDGNGTLDDINMYGLKDTGTFVKTLALLPLLKKMGVDVVYMLPISKYSLKDKKGELGSPYSVSNFYEIDPNLKDPITKDDLTVEDEFQAFVEACHILGMKVMIDIIPRTNAIENDLIIDHPDWFYWIKCDEFPNYYPPTVPSLGKLTPPNPEVLPEVYKSKSVWDHIRRFSYDPKTLDAKKYERLVLEYKQNPQGSFLDLIKKEYNIQIAPAFSDQINDPQPPWSDVTFFRMYLDHPVLTQQELKKYLKPGEDVPPYILFDTIKCNLYQGEKPNMELWKTLSDIIPYYQKSFGIDGARIDMGHALSSDLLDMIITKARQIDPNFCFIAEELSTINAEKAKKLGYNMIIGDGFWHEPRYKEHLYDFIYQIPKLPCPVFACGETHDTPRLAAREGKEVLAKMLTILNMFVPNGVPFINSGQEVYEPQPMNTGLDVSGNDLDMLDPDDPYYGKLALFDRYAFHYLHEKRWDIPDNLEKVASIRKEYLDTITNPHNFIPINVEPNKKDCISYALKGDNYYLLVLVNINPFEKKQKLALINEYIKEKLSLMYSSYDDIDGYQLNDNHNLIVDLQPGEVKIFKLY